MFGLAAKNNQYIYQMDVKTAFLYRDINLEIYVKLLPRFKKTGKVYKLNKVLYRLKQVLRIQYKTLINALKELGFTYYLYNNVVFKKGLTFILVYVDNLLITRLDLELIKDVKHLLKQRFKIKDIGEY